MARCVLYSYTAENPDSPGSYFEVYEQVSTPLDTCGVDNTQERVVMPVSEFTGEVSMSVIFDPDYLSVEQKQEIFVSTFSLPLIVYLVAWAYQTVINFATKDEY